MATEYFQRGSHLGYFILSMNIYFAFEIPVGHVAHTLGEATDSPQQHTTYESPTDEESTEHTYAADDQQQCPSGLERLCGCGVGDGRLAFGNGNEPVYTVE